MRTVRNAYNVLVGKHEGNRPPEKQRREWEDNIKMEIKEL
jgi:hypothetical protein